MKLLMRSVFVPENVSDGEKSTEDFLHLRKKNMYLVFFTLNERLFTANQSLTLASSEMIVEIGE